MTLVIDVSRRPLLTLNPAGVYEWKEMGQVAWCSEHESFQLTDPVTGALLHEVVAPKGKRRWTRERMKRLAEEVDALRAGGPRRERALKKAGL